MGHPVYATARRLAYMSKTPNSPVLISDRLAKSDASSETFKPSTMSLLTWQTTTAFKRCCVMVLLNQFFRSRNELKERSAAHVYSGNNSIKRICCSTSTNRLRTFHLRNDLYCVGWGVKLYSLTHSVTIISRNTLCASDSVLILDLFTNVFRPGLLQ